MRQSNETARPSYKTIARIRQEVIMRGGSGLGRPHIRRIDKGGYEMCSCGQKSLVTMGRGVTMCICCDALDCWPTFKEV